MKNVVICTKGNPFKVGDSFKAYRGFNNYLFSEKEDPIGKLVTPPTIKWGNNILAWDFIDYYLTNQFDVLASMPNEDNSSTFYLLKITLSDEIDDDVLEPTTTQKSQNKRILAEIGFAVAISFILLAIKLFT